MLTEATEFIADFSMILKNRCHIEFDPGEISHETCRAPVQLNKLNLKPGKGAVYVFSLTEKSKAPAGPNRVLKVGRVGPKSLPRFRHQHYKPGSANSTLAGSIKSLKILWDYIGIEESIIQQYDFGQWLIDHTDRDHFHMPKITLKINSQGILLLESFVDYLRGILGPVFEG